MTMTAYRTRATTASSARTPTRPTWISDDSATSATADPTGIASLGRRNCPMVPNADQTDTDHDNKGDDCDTDDDNDTICDIGTRRPPAARRVQTTARPSITPIRSGPRRRRIGDACDADLDGDGVNNENGQLPVDANVGQDDVDGDGPGDVCDADIDNDGVANAGDNCPNLANTDQSDRTRTLRVTRVTRRRRRRRRNHRGQLPDDPEQRSARL